MDESVEMTIDVNPIEASSSHIIEPTGEVNDSDDDQDYNTNVFIYNAIRKSSISEYQSDAELNDIWVRRYYIF